MSFIKKLKDWSAAREGQPELTRSQYSLVDCGDLTAETVQLWLGLPEEVKYDPALAPFRQFYEKENAKLESPLKKNCALKPRTRLPSVNSAPHLNQDEAKQDGAGDGPQDGNSTVKHLGGKNCKSAVEAADRRDHLVLHHGEKKPSKWDQARNYTKITLLVGCWVFFTVVFCMYGEKERVVRNTVLLPGEIKDYATDISKKELTLQIELTGPFLSEQDERKLNHTEKALRSRVEVWIERWVLEGEVNGEISESDVVQRENSTSASFILLNTNLDFSVGEQRSAILEHNSNLNATAVYVIRMKSDAPMAMPVSMSYTDAPIDVSVGITYGCMLLVMLYVMIIFEVINRTLAAIVVSTLSLSVLALLGARPSLPELISWLDVETLLLLLSMMLLVAIMAETGMFDFLAVFTFEVTKGKMWPLISVLCIITASLSIFLDNVTTVLLITPVTIKLCEVMEMHPIPVLIAIVVYSNVGGIATPVGDPPNVIISNNPAVVQSGVNFVNFTLHMTFGVLLVFVQSYFQFRFLYRDINTLRQKEPREIQDLRRQLQVWRRAADSLPHMSKDQLVVKERLERKVQKLTAQLNVIVKESKKRACPKDTFQRTLSELKVKYKIRDKNLLIKAGIALGFTVAMFFLHAVPQFCRVSLGWTALLGAILLLVLADREDLESILNRVEWSTLLFFAALFVLMEALTKLGVIGYIGGLTEALVIRVEETHRLSVALLLIVWISGITSAFVDNVPLTTIMIRVVTAMGTNPDLNLPLQPLIWALSFGVCLGGNGTLIGASANVVCAGVAEQHGYKITFMEFFRVGFPVMLGQLLVASAYLMICHCLFQWH
ncbi:P protein-like [Choristoneura fumiferana]|uniref:P protein-like n=1 Tax=Choristoneura fumiferana TaxID=7141 RepID=UPI003D15A1E4